MSKKSLPIALVFGPFDPTGSDGLPADAVTCAALGAHAVSVLTAVTTQDTADTESVTPCRAEQIDDQARCVLEDMPVQAIKVGGIPSVEAVSAVAQVAADYSQVPLVLHLGAKPVDAQAESEEEDAEDLIGATIELLLPQAHVVVLEHRRLTQWVTEEALEIAGQQSSAQALQVMGADWVLMTGTPQRPGHYVNVLVGPGSETLTWAWAPPPERVRDSGGIVSAALAALLAGGLSVPEAARAACDHAARALEQSFAPGMGQRIAARLPSSP